MFSLWTRLTSQARCKGAFMAWAPHQAQGIQLSQAGGSDCGLSPLLLEPAWPGSLGTPSLSVAEQLS